jgi:flagellin
MSLNSINTNTAALVALQGLNKANEQLQTVQNQVSTGYKVASAQDDSASFAIAQGLRGDLKGYDAIQEELSKAKGTMSVANTAAQSISDTLGDIRGVMTKLADDDLSATERTQYQGDYTNLKAQITNYIAAANYSGTNLLGSTTNVAVIKDLSGGSLTLRASNLTTDVLANLTAVTTSAQAQTMLGASGGLTTAETNLGNTMANLGADTTSLSSQYDFVGTLSDATTDGVGDIVDADMAKASAQLQSLQIRQQLATQTLSIANSSPNVLLSLFKS